MVVSRLANFQVTGSGNVTFAVDYSLAFNRSIEGVGSFGQANATLSVIIYSPFVFDFEGDFFLINTPEVWGANDALSHVGTLTFQFPLTDGADFFVRTDAESFLAVIPEPSSFVLIGISLAGIIGVSIRRTTHRPPPRRRTPSFDQVICPHY
jgi:hypothetical protein